MNCDIPKCKVNAIVKATFEGDEQYNLCAIHLEYKDDKGRKVFKDFAKTLVHY